MQSNFDQMKSVVRYMRSSLARALRGCEMRGREIAADAAAGRHAPCWLHEAKSKGPRPVVFEIHGGGFALGDARKEDALCEWIRDSFDVHVVGLDYRLAPENPAPAALDDVVASIRMIASGTQCDVDASRLVLLGYSAGASLALAAAFELARDAEVRFAGLALHYPFLDAATAPDEDAVRDIDLPLDLMQAFNEWYIADGDAHDPRISPAFATDAQIASLPFVGFYPVEGDELFAQAEAMAARMKALDRPAGWHPISGMYHGYIEDAANVAAYEAISLPETVAARPCGYVRAAAHNVKASLEEILGPAPHDIEFDGGR